MLDLSISWNFIELSRIPFCSLDNLSSYNIFILVIFCLYGLSILHFCSLIIMFIKEFGCNFIVLEDFVVYTLFFSKNITIDSSIISSRINVDRFLSFNFLINARSELLYTLGSKLLGPWFNNKILLWFIVKRESCMINGILLFNS